MVITLEKVIDGSVHILKRELSSVNSALNLWIDEQGSQITNSKHVEMLNNAKVGEEISSLLYETRYKIVDIQCKG